MMTSFRCFAAAVLLMGMTAGSPAIGAGPASEPWDGLVEVNSPRMDVAFPLPGVSNSVSNASEYRDLARQWAGISVKGLTNLRSHSPIPDPLKPGQKLN